MTIDTNITTKNPYRESSKLHTIFNFLADGERHSLHAITDAAYFPGASLRALYRRRTASALRTIRQRQGVFVDFDGANYRLMD